MAWALVKHAGKEALLNIDLLFAYVPLPNGKAQAISIAGATLDLDDTFADIVAALEQEAIEEETENAVDTG